MAQPTLVHPLAFDKAVEAVPLCRYRESWRVCGVYGIVNRFTRKMYVGSSRNVGIRIRQHRQQLRGRCHRNAKLQRSFDRHGEGAFVFLCLDRCEPNRRLDREQDWIDRARSAERGYGYNISPFADGREASEETRQRLSVSHTGNRHTEETKRKIGLAAKGNKYCVGKTRPPEVRAKISRFMSGPGHPMRGRRGTLNPNYGRKLPPEARPRILAALAKGWPIAHENNKKRVLQIDPKTGRVVAHFNSLKEAAAATGTIRQCISMVCRCVPHRPTANGFGWAFEEKRKDAGFPIQPLADRKA